MNNNEHIKIHTKQYSMQLALYNHIKYDPKQYDYIKH